MPADALREWLEAIPTPVEVTVTRAEISRFAVAVGADDPMHFDPVAARAAGYPDVVAPDLYYLALRTGAFSVLPRPELHEDGTPLRDVPPIEFRRAMAGETTAELRRQFVAGETVVVSSRRVGVRRKEGRSGPLTFVDFEFRYTDTAGEPVAVERFTRVFQ